MNQQGAHRYEDKLLELAYGELPAAEARSVEAHVKGCARCTGALQEIQGVRRQMSELAPEPAPDAGLESLLAYAQQSARRAQAGPAPVRGLRRWMFAFVGTASLAAVLLVVGVVSSKTRPELASMAPEAMKKEARREELRAQEAAEPAPVAASQAALPEAANKDQLGAVNDNVASPDVEAPAEPQAIAAAAAPATTAPAQAPQQAQVGRDVSNQGQWEVQPVDVTPRGGKAVAKQDAAKADQAQGEDYRLSTREDPKYRQEGADRFDRAQNFLPGRGTSTGLPTSRAQGVPRKSAPAPADGEMVFPSEAKASASKRSKKAPSKAEEPPLAGSGGGFAQAAPEPAPDVGGVEGRADAPAAQVDADDEGDRASISLAQKNAPRSPPLAQAKPPPAPAPKSDLFGAGLGKGVDTRANAGPSSAPPPAQALQVKEEQARKQLEYLAKEKDEASRRRGAEQEREVAATKAKAREAEESLKVASSDKAKTPAAPPPAAAPAPSPQVAAPEGASVRYLPSVPASGSTSGAGAVAPTAPTAAPQKKTAAAGSKVSGPSAQELFAQANRSRSGSPEEIDSLVAALGAGLSGQPRLSALQRLCTRLEEQDDERSMFYCSQWASADPGSAQAAKRLREVETRFGTRKARAKQGSATLDSATESAAPAQAAPAVKQ